ncbi:MAG: methionine adenosyltransferase [Solirubrobacteraceae bacterium]
MPYIFTSESVSEGHPDKMADQISDAIIDNYLFLDSESKVACETLLTTGQVIVAGEIHSKANLNLNKIIREVIRKIGYTKSEYLFDANSCGILSALHEQSADIRQGLDKINKQDQGAGDQGMMFGYATSETDTYMPIPLFISNEILKELAKIRKEEPETIAYLRPDAKAQVSVEYDDTHKPIRINTIVVSTQHDEFASEEAMLEKISIDIKQILIPRIKQRISENLLKLFDENIIYHINPTGKFVIGGPHGDTGLTGRKIIVDTYGGKGAHGGGAFSGKDPSKVDRSAAYAARHIAKNMVAAGVADEILVQVSYAIGVAKPISLMVNTYNTSKINKSDSEIAEVINDLFDMRPRAIEERLKLRNPIYLETASYGHMGRENKIISKMLFDSNGNQQTVEVELFTWEKLDYVQKIKKAFEL